MNLKKMKNWICVMKERKNSCDGLSNEELLDKFINADHEIPVDAREYIRHTLTFNVYLLNYRIAELKAAFRK